jgi:predicted flavoprotein YhiN
MNTDREFIKWFYEEAYPEQGSNRRQVYSTTQNSQNINIIDYWMREAFKAGAVAATNNYEVNALEQFEAFNINRNYPL